MIEVYRDRLKLDVMVVNAFNQILNIQPTNFEAADALAAQYETMKRWPDLISLLRKKAAVGRVADGEGRAAPARRQPVPREVLEPGRGDQGVRDDPRAGSRQRRGARVPQADVREAPRLGEAGRASTSARSTSSTDAGRAQGPPHRGRQARLREAEEAVGLDRAVAEGAGRRRRERRGAGRAREAVRAREGVGRARRRAGAAGGGRRRRHASKSAMLRQARHPLHREGAGRRRRRPRRGRRCWRRSRRTGARRTR